MKQDIQRTIIQNLKEIEAKEKVRVLFAVESGSRAWGFASPDSDYDVRFIFMRAEEDYLRIVPCKDVIEWKLDSVLDINGWDLKKALLAFGKGNPNIIEWTNSPIVYLTSSHWKKINTVTKKYFSEKAALSHYYGTAASTYYKYLSSNEVRYKKYFYALRPLLCCHWISRFHEAPPMRFETLLSLFDGYEPKLSKELLLSINHLLELKSKTDEKESNPQIPEIIDFIRCDCELQKHVLEIVKDDHKHDYTNLNEVFYETVKMEATKVGL